ncbi:MAG: DNA translocase FtsK [Parvibaculales bacterium]
MTQEKGGAAGRLLTQRLAEFFPISGIFWAVGIITTALILTLLSASLFRRSFSFLWAVILWLIRIRSFRPRLPLRGLFKKQKTTTDTGRTIERRKKKKKRVSKRAKAETQPHLNLSGSKSFDLPPLHLLSVPKENNIVIHEDALDANARLLENILLEFGVQGEIGKVRPGPVVTLYELSPAAGIRSSRIIGLADDIARSMSAISARVSTIPGKNTICIELPNQKREGVYLRELLETQAFESSKQGLSLALGKDIGGEIVLADLGKMPHLLIAGTTGSGKSVGINTMIMSLLYRYKPEQCRMIMVDPKKLELSVYDEIPHLLAPVVTEPRKAVVALKWVVSEMEARYQRMAERNVRNIDGYNDEMESAQKEGRKLTRKVKTGIDPDSGTPIMEEREEPPVILPRIVVIIDEMADLMMVAGKDVEAAIQRLAQMARAAGIHMIMATQRPSVDVITGTIKANFPTRISFQVTSKIDSRTILGEQGAEQLLGQGDMLYMSAGSKVQRVHGAFVSDKEVETIVRFLKKQGRPSYLEGITDEETQTRRAEEMSGNENGNLYDQAVAIIARDRRASISYIQRKLQIGYNRAASLIEEMEAQGVVSAPNAAGKREVLIEER